MFESDMFPRNVAITAVDIDPAMLTVATSYFGLKCDDRLKVVIDDGLVFLQKSASAGKTFGAILFDVDSKDASLGMSCPPPSFLDATVMENVQKCLGVGGVFVLNLVCRDEKQRDAVLAELRATFRTVCAYKLTEDVNEIVYCRNDAGEGDYGPQQWRRDLETAARGLNEQSRALKSKTNVGGKGAKEKKVANDDDDELVEVEDFLESLTL